MRWLPVAALLLACAVAAGAFGAHVLESRLADDALELWQTASRYLSYGALALAVMGLEARRRAGGRPDEGGTHRPIGRAAQRACWLLAIGTLVFSGTVGMLALGGPRWLGAVTPLGGLAMIAGLVVFAVAAWRE